MAGFTDESIQRVRDAQDIVGVVESYFPLKRSGARFQALCPFHNEKTPSFSVNPEMQIFKCFGCGEGGDVFRFVMKMEGLSFPEAVQTLADRAGIALERSAGFDPAKAREQADEKTAIRWVLSKTLQYFEKNLEDPRTGREAMEYLLERGFTKETIRTWRLGWAPARGELLDFLISESGGKEEKTIDYAIQAGVIRESQENDDVYEFFRGRVMFPISDIQHRPIAFGGRILKEDPNKRVGKYVNSPEGRLFSKSRVLFGLDAAAKEIRLSGTAVIVEGYTDVIMCHQYGLRNVVATLGTALTRDHINLLRRYAKTVIAVFDNDAAGQKATDSAVRLFVEEDMPLKVMRGEEVKDACEYLPRFGVEKYRELLDKAKDSFAYVMEQHLSSDKVRDVNARAEAIKRVMEVVNLSPDAMKREMLRSQVAGLAGVPAETLPQRQVKRNERTRSRGLTDHRPAMAGANGPVPSEVTPGDSNSARRAVVERRLLDYLAASRDWCDRACQVLPPEEYGSEVLRQAAAELHDAWNEGDEINLTAVFNRIQDGEASKLLSEMIAGEGPERTEEEFRELLCRGKLLFKEEESLHLQQEMQAASARGDEEEASRLAVRMHEVLREIQQLKQNDLRAAIDGSAA